MKRDEWQRIKWLFSMCKAYLLPYCVFTLLTASRNFLITYLIAFLSKTVIAAVHTQSVPSLSDSVDRNIFMLLLFLAIDSLSVWLQAVTVHKICNQIRKNALNAILHAKLCALGKIGNRAEVISRLNQDLDSISSILSSRFLQPLMYFVSGTGAIISVYTMDKAIAGWLIMCGILFAGIESVFAKRMRKVRKEHQEVRAALARRFEETFRLSLPIRMMNLARMEDERFEDKLQEYRSKNNHLTEISGCSAIFSQLNMLLQSTGILLLGIGLFHNNRLNVEDIVYFAQLAPLILVMFSSVGSSYALLQSSMTSVERMMELTELSRERTDGEDVVLTDQDVFVELKHAGIRFSNGNKAYQDLSLIIPAYRIVGVTGKSGSGKSSLMRSLLGLYEYTDGEILLWGKDVHRYRLDSLRAVILYVPQENILITGTIRNNLVPHQAEGVSDQRIEEILDAVGAAEWIQQKGGIEAQIDEKGNKLSGGQRQMLGIARALLSQAKALVFDEAFAGLDTDHVQKIMRYLQKNRGNRSIVIVSHDKK